MKNIIIIAWLLLSVPAFAQVKKITMQASGLTCSMCSNAINKSLKTIDFVSKVTPDIKSSSFDIEIKPGSQVDFDMIKKKVEDAGFFVARLSAEVNFDNVTVAPDEHINVGGMTMHFLKIKNQQLQGAKTIQVLDKGFISGKEFKKNQALTSMACYKTGVAEACCTKQGLKSGSRIYHVTI